MPTDEVDQGFRDLFRDLAIAWRSLSSYPAGHPVVASGLAVALQSVERILERHGPIELVATRDALLLGERRFDEPGPARLATLLRRRRGASILLRPGVAAAELERLLRALALEPRLASRAPSLSRELVEAGVRGIAVSDLDFSTLVLVEGDGGGADEGLWTKIARRLFHAGDLVPERVNAWVASGGSMAGLLRSMLGGASAAGSAGPGGAEGPAGAGAADGAGGAGGGVTTPGGGAGPGSAAPAEERLVSAAVAAYVETPDADPGELAELASWFGSAGRERLARELERALATRADGGRTLTAFFAALPPADPAVPSVVAPAADDPARLARLRRALASADIDIFAEEGADGDATAVLLELAGEEGPIAADPALEAEFESGGIARAVAASLLELAEREVSSEPALIHLLSKVEAAYRTLLGAGRLRLALELVERIQRRATRDDAPAAQFKRCAERLSTRESLGALSRSLAQLAPDAVRIARQLVERLGPVAARHLLGVLAESDDREQRRRLLDLLADLGPLVVRDATNLLADPRWYVVRNVLLLLRRVGDPGSLPAIRRCAEHADLRVRLEAIRNLFAFDQDLPRELLRRAFEHRDPKIAGEAIDLAGEHQMVEASEMLVALLRRMDPLGGRRVARLKAIRALAQIGDPTHLEGLRRFGSRFTLLPVAAEERVELFRSLAAYPAAAVAPWIARGKRARQAEVRRIAAELEVAMTAAGGESPPRPAEVGAMGDES